MLCSEQVGCFTVMATEVLQLCVPLVTVQL